MMPLTQIVLPVVVLVLVYLPILLLILLPALVGMVLLGLDIVANLVEMRLATIRKPV